MSHDLHGCDCLLDNQCMACNALCVARTDPRAARLQRLAKAGAWLRRERERRGFPTAKSLADALHVDPAQISNYERGANAVSDERAAELAVALKMSEVEVRRGLGLWVPDLDIEDDMVRERIRSMPDDDVIDVLLDEPGRADRLVERIFTERRRRAN